MSVPCILKTSLTKYLVPLVVIFQITACSSEENFNGSVSDGSTSGGVNGISTSMHVSWVAPAERDDGTGLSLSEIAGYRIYYGTTQGDYQNHININDGSAAHVTLDNLDSGVYYVVLTTIDTEGLESTFSSEIVKTI